MSSWNVSKQHHINEDDNDVIEYHGDIDPDKCYFNEFSHKLFKNCKHYTENSSNEYIFNEYNAFPVIKTKKEVSKSPSLVEYRAEGIY